MRHRLLAALAASFLLTTGAAGAQTGSSAPAAPAAQRAPTAQQTQAADAVAALLRGERPPEQVFTPQFLAQVPPAQIEAIRQQLVAQNGTAGQIEGITATSDTAGTISMGFERAVVRMTMGIQRNAPHLVEHLLVVGVDVRGDNMDAVLSELRALPGQVSFAVARLGEGEAELVAAHQPDAPQAIGSTFKLIILAELSRQVQAGQRRWSDVVTLDRRSLPSGMLQNWPANAPVTLHTLASMMISISDNTATDILLHTAGRDNVERMVQTIGLSSPLNRPFLSTLETFAIKGSDQVGAFAAADEAERRRILSDRFSSIDPRSIDVARLMGSGPNHIDRIEWFASARELVRVMDWLRRNGDETARSIMTINAGLAGGGASNFAYVGYKGGSEPGVINMTYLVRTRAGTWHVVTGSWNNNQAAVEDSRFAALMSRAVQMLR